LRQNEVTVGTPAPLLERLVAEGRRLSEVRATTGIAAK
jgi:hypothetical protein